MKNKILLIISATWFMIIISAPVFSQTSDGTQPVAKQTACIHVQPASTKKETTIKPTSVVHSNTTLSTNQASHLHVQPVSAGKEPANQAMPQSVHSTSVAKPIHVFHVQAGSPEKSTLINNPTAH